MGLSRLQKKSALLGLFLTAITASAAADEPPASRRYYFSRALRVAPTFQISLQPAVFPRASQLGPGLELVYEYVLSPRFVIGVNMAARFHPGDESMEQLGYGLLLKHYFDGDDQAGFRPFVEYGLLMQIVWASNHYGSGVAHDTRLGAGFDFRIGGVPLYYATSFHFSTAKLFDSETYGLNRVEMALGVRFSWF